MKVLLIDNDDLVTLSLKTILEAEGCTICAIGNDGSVALNLYKEHEPDVVLMDVRMENKSGIDASRDILDYHKSAKILLLTTFKDDDYIVEAIKLGVKGYLLKQDYASIVPAIYAVMANQTVFVEDIMHRVPGLIKGNDKAFSDSNLGDKELEIVECIAKGMNNKEISKSLYISEGTIRNYISNILGKLDLRDRTQIAIYYYTKVKG